MYGIYANIWGIWMVNVTMYSSTMDPMGMGLKVLLTGISGHPCGVSRGGPLPSSGQGPAKVPSESSPKSSAFRAADIRPGASDLPWLMCSGMISNYTILYIYIYMHRTNNFGW